MLLLPEEFGASTAHELCLAVDSMEEVMGISYIATAFAVENGFDIKMMMNLVEDIEYTGMYGMYNLVIRI